MRPAAIPAGPPRPVCPVNPFKEVRLLIATLGVRGALLLARKTWNLLLGRGPLETLRRLLRYRRRLAALSDAIQGRPLRHYRRWLRRYDRPGLAEARAPAWNAEPAHAALISVLLWLPAPETPFLAASLASLAKQRDPHWELCLGAPAASHAALRSRLAPLVADAHIRLAAVDPSAGTAAALNTLLAQATGPYVTVLEPGDLLGNLALYRVAEALRASPPPALLYSDGDQVDAAGVRGQPHFRPDWNPDLFLTGQLLGGLVVWEALAVGRAGGFRPQFDDCAFFDLALRVVESLPPGGIRHLPHPLYSRRVRPGPPAPVPMAAQRALAEHLERTGVAARVIGGWSGTPRVVYPLPAPAPLVSVIVPTRDHPALLRTVVEGVLRRTDYPAVELIVIDNGSRDPGALAHLEELRSTPGVKLLRDPRPFNFAALNNLGAAEARGDVLVLMNDDIRVRSPDWLRELASQACRPEIGAVGARLLYPNGTVQHAGVVLGVGEACGHIFKHLPADQGGYFGRAQLAQNYSAVTAACMAVRKAVFQEAGGLDERFAVAFNDVDFCLQLRQQGYRNLWTPHATLDHLESVSRGLDNTPARLALYERELALFLARWGSELRHDPAYNPNLSLEFEVPALAFPPRIRGTTT